MEDRANKLARFKAEHPVCYFCATAATETIDHVPSRECFADRVGPEGYEFPACARCNHGSGKIEQAVALYLLLANHEERDPSSKQMKRLLLGVRNNTPELMPAFEMNARAARKFFKQANRTLAPGKTFAETPLLQVPEGFRSAFDLFARRLTCALYYREVGTPLPLDYFIAVAWIHWENPVAADVARRGRELFPQLTLTNRRNTNIGEQFTYLWGHKPTDNLFGYIAQFSKSFLVMGGVVGPNLHSGDERWVLHQRDLL
jgi:hypothetical protein